MYSATFTFAKGEYDDEFHRRDQAIAEVARSIPGYLGEEAWENLGSGLISTVYYWDSMERRAAIPGQEHLPPSLLRLSVGIEDVEDLWKDLDGSLRAARS